MREVHRYRLRPNGMRHDPTSGGKQLHHTSGTVLRSRRGHTAYLRACQTFRVGSPLPWCSRVRSRPPYSVSSNRARKPRRSRLTGGFTSDRDGATARYLIDEDGSAITRLAMPLGVATDRLAWAADGALVSRSRVCTRSQKARRSLRSPSRNRRPPRAGSSSPARTVESTRERLRESV